MDMDVEVTVDCTPIDTGKDGGGGHVGRRRSILRRRVKGRKGRVRKVVSFAGAAEDSEGCIYFVGTTPPVQHSSCCSLF